MISCRELPDSSAYLNRMSEWRWPPLTLGGERETRWRQRELFVKNERSVSEPMTLDSQQRKYLEIIVVGLPHLAEAIAAIPYEHQARALDAVGRRYLKTFRQLGLSEPESQTWASSIMRRLRRQVAEAGLTEKDKLRTLYDIATKRQPT